LFSPRVLILSSVKSPPSTYSIRIVVGSKSTHSFTLTLPFKIDMGDEKLKVNQRIN
jgi:hypothetical protein